MDRRSFLRAALGIVAGLAALPFLPKRGYTEDVLDEYPAEYWPFDEPHVLTVEKWVGANGTEDQFAIFDRMLSPGEVKRHYEGALPQDNRVHHVAAFRDGRIYIDGELT